MTAKRNPTRSLRFAAYLAVVFGIIGVISGIAGAGTFIPYRSASTFPSEVAGALTAIAALGAVASLAVIVSGWGLLRARTWGWSGTIVASVACVGTVAAMAVAWPESWGFLVVVGLAYLVEFALLCVGRPSAAPQPTRTAAG